MEYITWGRDQSYFEQLVAECTQLASHAPEQRCESGHNDHCESPKPHPSIPLININKLLENEVKDAIEQSQYSQDQNLLSK